VCHTLFETESANNTSCAPPSHTQGQFSDCTHQKLCAASTVLNTTTRESAGWTATEGSLRGVLTRAVHPAN
jgi:hypothetical protein